MNEATPHWIVSALTTNQCYDGHQTSSLSRGWSFGTRLDQGNPCYVPQEGSLFASKCLHTLPHLYMPLSTRTYLCHSRRSFYLPPSIPTSCPLTCLYLYYYSKSDWRGSTPTTYNIIIIAQKHSFLWTVTHYIRLSAFIPACQTPSLATPCRSSPSIQHRSWTTCLMLHKSPSNYGLMQSKTDSSQYSIGTLDTHAYSVYALC